MSYYLFLFKKTVKNRSNWIPLVLLLAGIVGIYILNVTTGNAYSYTSNVKDHYIQTQELEDYYVKELNSDTDYSEKDIQMFEDGLQDISQQSEWNEQVLTLAEQKKWAEALGYSINILNRHIDINEQSGRSLFPSDYILALKHEILLYEQLMALNQEPDTSRYEKFGFTYVFRVMDSLFPMFIVLLLAVLLTEIFLNTYKKGIPIELLLPNRYIYIMIKKIVYAMLLAVSVYAMALLISYALASMVSGTGNAQYPILLYSSGSPETAPIWLILVKMFSLQLLSILNITLLISLISLFAKNRLSTLLISIIIMIGSSIALKSIEALHPFIHLNPFTYFFSGDVVTRLMTYEMKNANITFANGVILLSLFAVILMTAILMLAHRKEKNQMLSTK